MWKNLPEERQACTLTICRERERETANCMRLKRPIRDFVKHAAGQLFLKTGEGSNVIDIDVTGKMNMGIPSG